MVKTVVAVIVGLVLLNTAWFVLKIAILIVAERREYENTDTKALISLHTERLLSWSAQTRIAVHTQGGWISVSKRWIGNRNA